MSVVKPLCPDSVSINDWATVVPTDMEDEALVDALNDGKDMIVDMGSTGSSKRQSPSVESVFIGA